MLRDASGALLVLVLVLFSFLSYWLVWSLGGVGKLRRPAVQHANNAKGRTRRVFGRKL
jgi:hypothetical protein